jgi:hypothetical protein
MTIRSPVLVIGLIVARVATAAPPDSSFHFEEAVRKSDRIVVGTVQGTTGGLVTLPHGGTLALGIKDPTTGLVFTPYRVRVSRCLLDQDASCKLEDIEVLIPGGTVYETVDGEQRLRTWEVAGAAGVPLPPAGDDVLIFMEKRNHRYVPLNGRGARIPIDHASGTASVTLRFESPRLLSPAALESAQARIVAGHPSATRPEFVESVPLDRLKELIQLARQVPKPTSGTRHEIPDRADACASDGVRKRGARVRTGQVS